MAKKAPKKTSIFDFYSSKGQDKGTKVPTNDEDRRSRT
jgi:hypothetical protein